MVTTSAGFGTSLIQTLGDRGRFSHCSISLGQVFIAVCPELIPRLVKPGDTSFLCADLALKLKGSSLRRSLQPIQRLAPLLSLGQALIAVLQVLANLQQRLILALVTLMSSY
ncbi:Hypothetical protein PHPALM_17530 [Phytophthora palmivora]|uniref:Uncharacterized protein n=1 Tax=Phytophthora palmivora TaxID=4796 RepID=A0A2P4XM03_9STRA|nr:Hypothetical protein PHPALM_17530 [Phytophthora palmivora]